MDPTEFFDDADVALGPDAENVIVLANPVKPHSRGEIVLGSADPAEAPDIRMNYYSDPHDLDVMVAVVRKALEVVDNWPGADALGPMYVPTALAKAHDHQPGDRPTDELIRDMARHYSITVYHLTSTCTESSLRAATRLLLSRIRGSLGDRNHGLPDFRSRTHAVTKPCRTPMHGRAGRAE